MDYPFFPIFLMDDHKVLQYVPSLPKPDSKLEEDSRSTKIIFTVNCATR